MSARSKLFIENILIYGLGGSIGKVIPFLIIPVITRLLPSAEYYGYFDIVNLIVSFSSALALLGMSDMMFRMFFEKDTFDYKTKVCSSSLFPVVISGIFMLTLLVVFQDFFSLLFFNTKEFSRLVVISGVIMFVTSLKQILSGPTRMQDKKKAYLTINFLSSLISSGVTIAMLLMGYFLLALPTGLLISALFSVLVYSKLNYKWFNFKFIDYKLIKEMLTLGLPLVPVFLFYWIFNSFDRLMISRMIGNDFLGVYAVGAKISSVSHLIYGAFASGWQYFAFSTMKDKDQVQLTSNIFEYLGLFSFCAVAVIIPFVKPFFELLFEGDYVNGYVVMPYLFFSPLILMLFQTGGNQFLVVKKTYYFALILLLGAIVNVLFNYLLIPVLGIEGASIATLFGYLFSTILASIILIRLKLLMIKGRLIVSFLITIILIVVSRIYIVENIALSLFFSSCVLLIFAFLFKTEVKLSYSKVKMMLSKK